MCWDQFLDISMAKQTGAIGMMDFWARGNARSADEEILELMNIGFL